MVDPYTTKVGRVRLKKRRMTVAITLTGKYGNCWQSWHQGLGPNYYRR